MGRITPHPGNLDVAHDLAANDLSSGGCGRRSAGGDDQGGTSESVSPSRPRIRNCTNFDALKSGAAPRKPANSE